MTNEQARLLAEKIGGPLAWVRYESMEREDRRYRISLRPGMAAVGKDWPSAFLAAGFEVKKCSCHHGTMNVGTQANPEPGMCDWCDGIGLRLTEGRKP